MEAIKTLSEQAVKRLADIARKDRHTPRVDMNAGTSNYRGGVNPRTMRVKVSGSLSSGLYNANMMQYDPSTQTESALATSPDCWIDPRGASFNTGDILECVASGVRPADGLMIFIPSGSGSAAGAIAHTFPVPQAGLVSNAVNDTGKQWQGMGAGAKRFAGQLVAGFGLVISNDPNVIPASPFPGSSFSVPQAFLSHSYAADTFTISYYSALTPYSVAQTFIPSTSTPVTLLSGAGPLGAMRPAYAIQDSNGSVSTGIWGTLGPFPVSTFGGIFYINLFVAGGLIVGFQKVTSITASPATIAAPSGMLAASAGDFAPLTSDATPTPSLAASGTTQGTALEIPAYAASYIVTTATGGVNDGVRLNPTAVVSEQALSNQSGATVKVYPPIGAAIDALGTNNPLSVTNGKSVLLRRASSTQWLSFGA